MGHISFTLEHNNGGAPIKRSRTLLDIWKYIKQHINVPQDWCVTQFNDEDTEDACSAGYLIETFKTEESVPKCISDINK